MYATRLVMVGALQNHGEMILAITSVFIEETRLIVCMHSSCISPLRTMIIRASICGVSVHINNDRPVCLLLCRLWKINLLYSYSIPSGTHEPLNRFQGIINYRCFCRPSSGGRHSGLKAMDNRRCLYFPWPRLGCVVLSTLRTICVKKWSSMARFSFFLPAPLNVLYLLRNFPTVALVAQFPSRDGVYSSATENACTRPWRIEFYWFLSIARRQPPK